MSSFRIRSTSTVALPAGAASGEPLPLSAFDSLWVTHPPLLNVFLFPSTTPATPFPVLVDSLKRSLSQTLPLFHPFAGELTYLPSSQSVAIVCRDDGPGATFIEAETDVDFQGLIDADELDDEVLRQLVPDIWWDALPAAPLLAAQATEFVGGGGVAVGLACHHAVVDGHGLIQFMKTWAAVAERSGPDPPSPLHDRRLVRFDGDEEFTRSTLCRMAPNLPSAVREVKANPLKHMSDKDIAGFAIDSERTLLIPGSPWFPMYEFDLGFGRPARVERAGLDGPEQAYLTAGMSPGSVQAMMVISAGKIQAFREAFKLDAVDGDGPVRSESE
ncbi:hypothetical protein ACP70R_011977 [Stipagrostis hirtigluma subsp. patula]